MSGRTILIVGHGSRDREANDEFLAFVASYRARNNDAAVDHAYIELAHPALADALRTVASSSDDVVVVPLLLFAAGHVKNDIPIALARARKEHPRVRFHAAPALGVHGSLAEVAFDRAASIEALDPARAARTAFVVVGRGSSDPDANGDFCKVVRLVAEGRGLMRAEPAFIGITRPAVEETLEHVARARPDQVIVIPYFLFAGQLITKLRAQIAEFAQRYPWVRARLAPHLGEDPRLFALIDERVDQAFAGRAPLPCDTCMYRTALPGVAEQVGGLQALLYSVRHSVTHTQSLPHEHAHRALRKHVLVCGNADCVDRGSLAVLDALRRLVKEAGSEREIKITRTSCMGRCGEGPTVAVYPDGIWYRGVRDGDARDLVRDHLLGDRLVARLVDNVMQ